MEFHASFGHLHRTHHSPASIHVSTKLHQHIATRLWHKQPYDLGVLHVRHIQQNTKTKNIAGNQVNRLSNVFGLIRLANFYLCLVKTANIHSNS